MRIGLISDTHGLLRPAALEALRGCAKILHGGDIGDPSILRAVSSLAPVTAVRGNNDSAPWARRLPRLARVACGSILVGVVHDLQALRLDPVAAGLSVIVSGHSHRPLVRQAPGVLYVNPGSAGARRFRLPVSVGELLISGQTVQARILLLEP